MSEHVGFSTRFWTPGPPPRPEEGTRFGAHQERLSSLYAVSPASRRFAHAAHCQCGAFVVVCRFAGFATLSHKSHIVKSLIVPYLVFLGFETARRIHIQGTHE